MAGLLENLDTAEGLEARRHRHWYDRLMMLADGVFAIAITFLATYIGAPDHWGGDWPTLATHLSGQLSTYSTSFLVISIYWLAHRRFMAMVLTVDAPMTILTLVMLGLIALLPPATRLVSTYAPSPAARVVYAALVISIGLSMAVMWAYASLVARLVSSEVGAGVRWYLLLLMIFTPPFFLALTLTAPVLSAGVAPTILAGLFLVGWPMRRLVIRWLGGKPYVG